jgi:hypothetical protein
VYVNKVPNNCKTCFMTTNQKSLRSASSALIAFSWIAIIAGVVCQLYAFIISPTESHGNIDIPIIIAGVAIISFGVLMLALGRFFDVVVDISSDLNELVSKKGVDK